MEAGVDSALESSLRQPTAPVAEGIARRPLLPSWQGRRAALPARVDRAAGWQLTVAVALALVMLGSTTWMVISGAAGASPMVPISPYSARWLRGLAGEQLSYRVFLSCLLAFAGAYAGLLALARRLPAKALIGLIGVLYLIVFAGPVLVSTDVFSYIAYARMGVIHGLNPYVSVPFAIRHDAVYPFVGSLWTFVPSAYGPLYTLLSYPFALVGVIGALWGMKALAVAACVAIDWLVWRCAQRRGFDPRLALLIVGANPLLVIYSLASAQNDFLMIALMMMGIYLTMRTAVPVAGEADGAPDTRLGTLDTRAGAPDARGGQRAVRRNLHDARAAAAVVAAALVKVPAAVVLPFMVIGRRRLQPIAGTLLAGAVGLAVAYAVFGARGIDILSGVKRDASYVSGDSFATMIAHMLGKPGVFPVDHALLKGALVIAVLYLLVRTWRGYDWISASGWALLATAVISTWLMAWYLVWPLPVAVISRDRRLLWATLLIQALFVIHQLSPMFAPQ